MSSEILVSVIIPVKNGDDWLHETIPSILSQQLQGAVEIIAIDSGSTDKTLSVLSGYPVTVITIKPEDFNHGLTRNMGVLLAKGKFVVMTVQDAKPTTKFWLQHLLDGFIDDTVAGVCGQQAVPHHRDKNPVEWYRPVSKPVLRKQYFTIPEDFTKLSPQQQLALCRWDDVNAMYRRDALLQLPFRETDFAEDALWARDAMMAGYTIVYNPAAQVKHYHQEDYGFAYKRNFIVQYHFHKYFATVPSATKQSLRRRLSIVKLLITTPGLSFSEKWKWWLYNRRIDKAIQDSNKAFLDCLEKGGQPALDILYRQTIQAIPQALKTGK